MRLARMSQEASSGTLRRRTRASASQAALKPATPATLPSAPEEPASCRPCRSGRWPHQTVGMSFRIVDSKATGAGDEGGHQRDRFLTVFALAEAAGERRGHVPAAVSEHFGAGRARPPAARGRAMQGRRSIGCRPLALPALVGARACAHLTARRTACRAAPACPRDPPERLRGPPAPSRSSPGVDAAAAGREPRDELVRRVRHGDRDVRLRRRKPTAFSTDPFSFPE